MHNNSKAVDMAPLAQKACEDPFFNGFALSSFQESQNMTDLALVDYLRMPPSKLTRLILCRRPRHGETDYKDNFNRIATFCECDIDRLSEVLDQAKSSKRVFSK